MITAIIPTYNHAKYLPICLDSLFMQTKKFAEIIVIDDCSTDNTQEVLKNYPTITILKNNVNVGLNKSLDKALKFVETEFVFFIAADDALISNDFVADADRCINKYPFGVIKAFAGLTEWKCKFTGLNWCDKPRNIDEGYVSPTRMIQLAKEGCMHFNPGSIIWSTQEFIKCGGYISELHQVSDTFAMVYFFFQYPVYYSPKIYSELNLRPGSFYRRSPIKHKMLMYRNLIKKFEEVCLVKEIKASGLLGMLDPTILFVLIPFKLYYINFAFIKRQSRRWCEIFSRKFLPPIVQKPLIKLRAKYV